VLDGVVVQVMDGVKKAGIKKLGRVTDLMIGPEMDHGGDVSST
jgi:hypothetical protein